MTDEVKPTQEEAVNPSDEVQEETQEQEETVGETMKQEEPAKEEKPTVGLDKFLSEKKARKDAEQKLQELQQRAQQESMSSAEINLNLQSLADQYNIDPKFLSGLAKAIKEETNSEWEERISSTLKPFQEKEKQEKLDAAFDKGFKKAMENMPEFEGIVNPEVIKTLSLNPSNKDKTFRQLIEDTYSNALQGRKTVETSTPRGGADPQKLDYELAKTDTAYFKQVMADPKLKAEYNAKMLVDNG